MGKHVYVHMYMYIIAHVMYTSTVCTQYPASACTYIYSDVCTSYMYVLFPLNSNLGYSLSSVIEFQCDHIHEVQCSIHQSQEPLLSRHCSQLLDRLALLQVHIRYTVYMCMYVYMRECTCTCIWVNGILWLVMLLAISDRHQPPIIIVHQE